jgi:hypothetical protein
MQNAHRRLGRLEYLRSSERTNMHVFLHVDHYVGDGEQAHLLSLFGGDAEVGAVRAAIYEKHVFTLTFRTGDPRRSASGWMRSATTARSPFRARSAPCGIWWQCLRHSTGMVLLVRPS